MKTRKLLTATFATVIGAGSADAEMVLTDHPQGETRTTFYDSLVGLATGNRPPETTVMNRFSLDAGDRDGQSFTLDSVNILDSIYLAYNDQQSTGSFDLEIDVGNDGSADHTFSVTVTNALQSGGGNSGPVHFLQFGLASESIELDAGTHSFSVVGQIDNGEGDFLIAPMWAGNEYDGGQMLSNSGRDLLFAVTAAPETSSVSLADFSYDPQTGDSEVSIEGEPNTAYVLVEADDLDFGNPDRNPVPLTGAIVGTLSGDQVTTDVNGAATVQFNLGTAKPATFIRAKNAPPPPPLLSEDFDEDDGGFTGTGETTDDFMGWYIDDVQVVEVSP
jgi:hypothetical protein